MSVTRKLTKNEKKRIKQKNNGGSVVPQLNKVGRELVKSSSSNNGTEVEYVSVEYQTDHDKSILEQFLPIFQKFSKPEDLLNDEKPENGQIVENSNGLITQHSSSEMELEETTKLSKKKRKLASRLSAAELKQLVARPDAVEAHDVTSSDPRLLVYLKSYRNTVPVPRHWCAIRKYLQGKRGVEKIPFQLPEFIAETGIAKIRESVLEMDSMKKGKQKTRERVKPKMGKIDIDYQVLHDAFFKYQTKPKMTDHGDLYYEGKEFEVCFLFGPFRQLRELSSGQYERKTARSTVCGADGCAGDPEQRPSPMVGEHAALRHAPLVPQSQDPRAQRATATRRFFWLPARRMGKATHRRVRPSAVWRRVWYQRH